MTNILDIFNYKKLITSETLDSQVSEITQKLKDAQKRIYGKYYLLLKNLCYTAILLAMLLTTLLLKILKYFDILPENKIIMVFISLCIIFIALVFFVFKITRIRRSHYESFRKAYIKEIAQRAHSNSIRGDVDIIMLEIMISMWLHRIEKI